MVISEKILHDFENLAKTEQDKNKIVRIYNPLDTDEIIEKSEVGSWKLEEIFEKLRVEDFPRKINI